MQRAEDANVNLRNGIIDVIELVATHLVIIGLEFKYHLWQLKQQEIIIDANGLSTFFSD